MIKCMGKHQNKKKRAYTYKLVTEKDLIKTKQIKCIQKREYMKRRQ